MEPSLLYFLGLHLRQFEVDRTRLQGDQLLHQAGRIETGLDAKYGGECHGRILFKF